jgi:hypothetical protein
MTLRKRKKYRKLKEKAPDRTLWRNVSGEGCAPVVRDYGVNEWTPLFRTNLAIHISGAHIFQKPNIVKVN